METGERLTTRAGTADDIFHSRLRASPGGAYLLSAGWIWHPAEILNVYDVALAIEDPRTLDGRGVGP
ncbi:MAG: hypothetical protein ACRDY1_13860 [Acidimicrobiales bacterium]